MQKRSHFANAKAKADFVDAVLAVLARADFAPDVKNPTDATRRAGEESISYLRTELRDKGFRIPAREYDFKDALKEAGFSFREARIKGGYGRTYVTL